MIKKVAIGSLALATLGTVVFGRDAYSYLCTGVQAVQDTVRGEVPVEFEIERARHEVEQLVPEIRKSMHLIAREQVEVEHLSEAIARRESEMERQEDAILELSARLKTGETRFVVAGRTYNEAEVQRDLAERFNRFKTAEEALNADRETRAAREHALQAHRDALEGMLSQRKTLEVELERLEARVRTIAARQTISDLAVDQSQLAHCKSLIRNIDGKLDVEEKLLDADANFAGLIPVEEEAAVPEDLMEQVDTYFQDRSPSDTQSPVEAGAF